MLRHVAELKEFLTSSAIRAHTLLVLLYQLTALFAIRVTMKIASIVLLLLRNPNWLSDYPLALFIFPLSLGLMMCSRSFPRVNITAYMQRDCRTRPYCSFGGHLLRASLTFPDCSGL